MAMILDGKKVAQEVKDSVKKQAAELLEKGVSVGLAVVIVGENPASKVYVKNKKKDCEEVLINSFEYALPEETSQKELLALIDSLNGDPKINGILVQLPLPAHINEKTILEAISEEKDVDAFHPQNVGRIMIGDYKFLPCTPAGVMQLLKSYKIETNRLIDAQSRQNLNDDIQSLVRAKLRKMIRVHRSRKISRESLEETTRIIISSTPALQQITSQDSLFLYIELYMVKLLLAIQGKND